MRENTSKNGFSKDASHVKYFGLSPCKFDLHVIYDELKVSVVRPCVEDEKA